MATLDTKYIFGSAASLKITESYFLGSLVKERVLKYVLPPKQNYAL